MTQRIKAISLWQPWASLIVAGVKPFEFRFWPAPRALWNTRIVIHAAARLPRPGEMQELATAVKPRRMKLHYGGTPEEAPKHAFAERGVAFAASVDGQLTFRVGKKAAGALLDGREHREFPR